MNSLPISSTSDLAGISVDSLLNFVDLASIYVPPTVGQAPGDIQASAAHLSSPGPSTTDRAPASDQIAVSSLLQSSGAPASDLAPASGQSALPTNDQAPATHKMPVSVYGAPVGSIVNEQPGDSCTAF